VYLSGEYERDADRHCPVCKEKTKSGNQKGGCK